jgi:hypothetical protein
MFGPFLGKTALGKNFELNEQHGLVVRFISSILARITPGSQLLMSMFQIYNENVFDLLSVAKLDPRTSRNRCRCSKAKKTGAASRGSRPTIFRPKRKPSPFWPKARRAASCGRQK